MIRGAILDIDGTMFDSMDMWLSVGSRYLKKMGIDVPEGIDNVFKGMALEEGDEYIVRNFLPEKTTDEVAAGIEEIVTDFYENEARLKPGAYEFAKKLHEKGIPVAVATMSNRPYIESALKRVGIFDWLEGVFVCSESRTSKHEPFIYRETAKALGEDIPYSDIWVFEDVLYAVKTASGEGFKVAALYDKSSESNKEEIAEICDIYMESFEKDEAFWEAAGN